MVADPASAYAEPAPRSPGNIYMSGSLSSEIKTPPVCKSTETALKEISKHTQTPTTMSDNYEVSSQARCSSEFENCLRRTSFDSVREETTDVPQSFASSIRISSNPKNRTSSDVSGGSLTARSNERPILGGDTFQPGQTEAGFEEQSKDIENGDDSTAVRIPLNSTSVDEDVEPRDEDSSEPQRVGLDHMPFEVLDLIISLLAQDTSSDDCTTRNTDLVSCLQTSRAMHAATLNILYRHVAVPHSMTFSKVMKHLANFPEVGALVRRLDFSHYTSFGFGRTRQASSEVQNVTPQTLLQFLDLTPNLNEFLVHELVDEELKEEVLRKLFSMPSLHALDLCACSSSPFTLAFTEASTGRQLRSEQFLPVLRRLSLHECSTLQAPVFEALLPRLTNLTHLDLGHTLINDKALMSIPKSAKLTHLNLGRCTRITGRWVVEFLTSHDAARDTLIYLNLMADPSRYRLLSESDVEKLIPLLPQTLRSLNLGGAPVTSNNIHLLLPLTKVLEELSIAHANISMADVNSLFVPKTATSGAELSAEEPNWIPSALRYLDMTGIHSITQRSLFSNSCLLVSPHSNPLEAIELDDEIIKHLGGLHKGKKPNKTGWVVRELGRRGWYVRQQNNIGSNAVDHGRREWKNGARWWGMRKVPVAVQEVGGMYGHYMFKN